MVPSKTYTGGVGHQCLVGEVGNEDHMVGLTKLIYLHHNNGFYFQRLSKLVLN
jgi:hypothetical protein